MMHAAAKSRTRQRGVAAVEFSLVVIIFLTFVFATLELARIEYLANTLLEATRRAAASAANVDFKNNASIEAVKAGAIFRDSSGPLVLGDPVTADNVAIDYLSVDLTTMNLKHVTSLPSSPAKNRWNCVADSNSDECIRFVRARICASMDSAGNCEPLGYQMMFPFFDLSGMLLPTAETIVPAGSLGYTAGTMPGS